MTEANTFRIIGHVADVANRNWISEYRDRGRIFPKLRISPRHPIWLVPVGLAAIFGFAFFIRWAQSGRSADVLEKLDVEIFARDFLLQFRYPGKDQTLKSEDDRYGSQNLYVPAAAVVRLILKSHDYVYTVEIPQVGVYEIAAPDLTFEVQFVAPESGTCALLGSQMCGYDHPQLLGELIVQSPAEFCRTMERLSSVPLQTAQ